MTCASVATLQTEPPRENPLVKTGPHSTRLGLCGVLAVLAGLLGLVLYVWPALKAPIVLWSDSHINLGWVRAGVLGSREAIAREATRYLEHPLKIGYLAFLRIAMSIVPDVDETRSIVLVQSLLLWLSISGTCLYVARRSGNGWLGLVLYFLTVLCLRLRDSASAIMSEAISAALALPLAAIVLFSPRRRPIWLVPWGAGCGWLYWMRPNLALLVLAFALAILFREWKAMGLVMLGFAAVFLPLWLVSRPPDSGHPLREIATPILAGSFDYVWLTSWSDPPDSSRAERAEARIRQAATNWRRSLSDHGVDSRRQLVWRALHGLFATEYYDPRWSKSYAKADAVTRVVTPFVMVAAVGVLLAFPFSGSFWRWNVAGGLLILGLAAQNLLLGSLPRFVLPLLPVIFMVALTGVDSLRKRGWRYRGAAIVLTAGLILLIAWNRGIVDWQSGHIEASGIEIVQRIPKRALPGVSPVTLHVRIAPALLPTKAQLSILGPGGQALYWSPADTQRHRAFVTVALPTSVLEANQRSAVDLRLVSFGDYGPSYFLEFPVVPIPWGARARRIGSPELSPTTAITAGSLDWWAHPGFP